MTLTSKDVAAIDFILQATKAKAWEQAIDTAYTHHLTEEQRDHLHTLNPHKENN